jgi:hypothetical protein
VGEAERSETLLLPFSLDESYFDDILSSVFSCLHILLLSSRFRSHSTCHSVPLCSADERFVQGSHVEQLALDSDGVSQIATAVGRLSLRSKGEVAIASGVQAWFSKSVPLQGRGPEPTADNSWLTPINQNAPAGLADRQAQLFSLWPSTFTDKAFRLRKSFCGVWAGVLCLFLF